MALARRRPGGERVRWIVGGADGLGTPGADLAIMTGHVAQFFLRDEAWQAALDALHGALAPGGRLAFESRDPRAREWETWTRDRSRTVHDATAGKVETWSELGYEHDGLVSYDLHYAFAATGEEVVIPSRLRFRSEAELRDSLHAAGFRVDQIYGDWDRRPAGPGLPELIVVAVS